jgi:L-asparagine transporter-like permease
MTFLDEIFKSSQEWWNKSGLKRSKEQKIVYHYYSVIIFSFLLGLGYILYSITPQEYLFFSFLYNSVVAVFLVLGYSIKYTISGFNQKYDVSNKVRRSENFSYIPFSLLILLLLTIILFVFDYKYDIMFGLAIFIFSYYYYLSYEIVREKYL